MPCAADGRPGSDGSDVAAAAPRSGGTKRRRRGPRYQRSFVSAPEVDLRSTESRYRLLDGIAHLLRRGNGRGPAVCGCGLPGYDVDEIEWRVARNGRARPVNIWRCKSAILCPVCAVWQARKLQERLQEVVEATVAIGGSVGMLTLTFRHHRGHQLKQLRLVATEAFRRVESGRGWLKLKREGGLLGQVKVLEAPWGPAHGWHPHLHLLLVFDHRDEARARTAAAALEARWIREVSAHGFEALPVGQNFEPCYDPAGAAGYCAKLAAELAHGWAKHREGPDRYELVGIFTLAHRAIAGDQEARRLFLEYAEAMSGLQQGRVSKPLREALKLTERPAFDGGVAKDRGGETVGCQPREQYMELYARGKLSDLVAVIERECPPDIGIAGWPRVSEWIEAALRPLPQPPRPPRRIPAELIAREVRGLRPAFPKASTAELVERRLQGYRAKSYASLVVVLPDVSAVLAELASS